MFHDVLLVRKLRVNDILKYLDFGPIKIDTLYRWNKSTVEPQNNMEPGRVNYLSVATLSSVRVRLSYVYFCGETRSFEKQNTEKWPIPGNSYPQL